MAYLDDCQEFAMLQHYWGAHYEEPEIMQAAGELAFFCHLRKRCVRSFDTFES